MLEERDDEGVGEIEGVACVAEQHQDWEVEIQAGLRQEDHAYEQEEGRYAEPRTGAVWEIKAGAFVPDHRGD